MNLNQMKMLNGSKPEMILVSENRNLKNSKNKKKIKWNPHFKMEFMALFCMKNYQRKKIFLWYRYTNLV
jgi:hypothetical protein